LFVNKGEKEFEAIKFIIGLYSVREWFFLYRELQLNFIALSLSFLSKVFIFQLRPRNINKVIPTGGNINSISIHERVFSGLFLPNKIIIKIINMLVIYERYKIILNASI